MSELPPGDFVVYQVIRSSWLSRKPWVGAQGVVVISTLLLVLLSLLYWRFEWPSLMMPATRAAVFERGEVWRLWSTLFAHADLGHMLSNSFLFFILGFFLAGYFGWATFPAAALGIGGVINSLALLTYKPETQLIGMSGVVFWMGGVWLTLYTLINRQKSVRERILRSIGVALLLFAPSEVFDPQISYRTHAIGFALGVLYAVCFFLWYKREFRAAERIETVIE